MRQWCSDTVCGDDYKDMGADTVCADCIVNGYGVRRRYVQTVFETRCAEMVAGHGCWYDVRRQWTDTVQGDRGGDT